MGQLNAVLAAEIPHWSSRQLSVTVGILWAKSGRAQPAPGRGQWDTGTAIPAGERWSGCWLVMVSLSVPPAPTVANPDHPDGTDTAAALQQPGCRSVRGCLHIGGVGVGVGEYLLGGLEVVVGHFASKALMMRSRVWRIHSRRGVLFVVGVVHDQGGVDVDVERLTGWWGRHRPPRPPPARQRPRRLLPEVRRRRQRHPRRAPTRPRRPRREQRDGEVVRRRHPDPLDLLWHRLRARRRRGWRRGGRSRRRCGCLRDLHRRGVLGDRLDRSAPWPAPRASRRPTPR